MCVSVYMSGISLNRDVHSRFLISSVAVLSSRLLKLPGH